MKIERVLVLLSGMLAIGATSAATVSVNTVSGLVDAIAACQDKAFGEGDVIEVAAGTYAVSENIVVDKKSLRIVGAGKGETVFDGGRPAGAESGSQIFNVTAEGVNISGITFRNCGSAGTSGGAIGVGNKCYRFELVDCAFSNCLGKAGGAVSGSLYYGEHDAQTEGVFPDRGAMGVISGCDFVDCEAAGSDGYDGGGAVSGAFWIENSTFGRCSSRQFAAAVYTTAHLMVTNCVFTDMSVPEVNPRATVWQDKSVCEIRVLDSRFERIVSNALVGINNGTVPMLIDRCEIVDCAGEPDSADNNKPSIFYQGKGVIRNSLVRDNRNPFDLGNAGYVNCTFIHNAGGLIIPFKGGAEGPRPGLTNCLFYANTAFANDNFRTSGGLGICWHGSSMDADVYKNISLANCVFCDTVDPSVSADRRKQLLGQDPTGESARISRLVDDDGPGFVDEANGDFNLHKRSVLIDLALRLPGMEDQLDLAGHFRCFRKGQKTPDETSLPDIGCYEFYTPVRPFIIRLR